MLKAALALFPILSAYLFCSTWHLTKCRLARLEREQYFLTLTGYAVVFYFAAILFIIAFLINTGFFQDVMIFLEAIFGNSIKNHYAFAVLAAPASVILAVLSAHIFNAIEALISRLLGYPSGWLSLLSSVENDDFDIIFARALKNRHLISITLSNGKVYVGYVVHSIHPRIDIKKSTIRILPVMSGYRVKDTHELKFVTNYSTVGSSDLKKEYMPILMGSRFEIAILKSMIVTVNLFDMKLYANFSPENKENTDADSKSVPSEGKSFLSRLISRLSIMLTNLKRLLNLL